MNIDKNLVLVKGQDKTKDIRTWEYKDGWIIITFNNSASFRYACNVEFLKVPIEIKVKSWLVFKQKQPLMNVIRIQDFSSYLRIFYKSGYVETINSSDVKIVKSLSCKFTVQ